MWKIEIYFVVKILLSIVLVMFFLKTESDLKIIIKDQLTSEVLPFSSVSVCGENYVSDERGELIIKNFYSRCTVVVQRLGYEIFREEVLLRDKKTIVVLLKEEPIELNQVTVSTREAKPLKVTDILEKMLLNFKVNHLYGNVNGKMEEKMSFSFGFEPVIQRTGKLTFKIDNGGFDLLESKSNYVFSMENKGAYNRLESLFVNNPSTIIQVLQERSINRSDAVENDDCDNLSSLSCYLERFFPVKRNLLFNPLFNHNLKTQDLDHFGFVNSTFLETHKFKLEGISQINGRECYKIRIVHSSKSIPVSIAGNSAKDFYVPKGMIFIDLLTFAILKMEYAYSLNERNTNKAFYTDESKSGEIFFENIINFEWTTGKWLPSSQFLQEKDRSVKTLNASGGFDNGYLIKHIKYSYD